MAQNDDLWHELEDKLKSLTSSLQSLPSEMRDMALSFITKQMESKDGNRSSSGDTAASEKPVDLPQQSNNDEHQSTSDAAAIRLPKKRGRSAVNGVSSPASTVPFTSNILLQKKRGRPSLSSSQPVNKEVSVPVNIDQTPTLPKKRGRPPSAQKSESMTGVQLTINCRKSGRNSDICKGKPVDEDTEAVLQTTRSSQRVRRKPKSFADEDDSVLRDAGNMIGSKKNVILVPVDERHLSAAMSACNDTESTDESSHSVHQEESSVTECYDAQTKNTSHFSAVRVKSEPEYGISDAEQASFYGSLRKKKRGRPRKTDILSRQSVAAFYGAISNTAEKKPIGRPRFSTYESGYVPKPKLYRCQDCGKNLASRSSLREHVRRHTGDLYMCDLCGQKFTTNSGFLLHKKYHVNDPEVFKCTFCKYTVSSQKLLDEHYEARHDPNRPRQHTCYVCGKGFHQAIQLEKHLVSHASSKPYVCDECDFATAYPGGLEKHKYNVHEREHRQLFECELCHVKLRSRGTYNEHLGRHFNQRNKKCETCQKTFPTASQLASHRRSHLDPKIPCEFCGKLLRNKHKMKIHMFLHTGQKDFACPYCSYVTYVKHNLKKHCAARHKIEYPPVVKPMKKYLVNDATTIAASLTDPLAIRCVRKIVTAGTASSERGSNLETPGVIDDSATDNCESLNSGSDDVGGQRLEPVSSMSDIVIDSQLTNSIPVTHIKPTGDTSQLEPSFSKAYCTSAIANNYTSGHSVVSNVVPIFSLPLFSSYSLSNNLVATPISSVTSVATAEEKSFITLTPAVGDQQAFIIAPTFSSL